MNTTEQGNNNNKWIWIGLGAATLLCCCAVIVAVLVFRQIGKTVEQGMKTDPESASQSAHEIADYTLPDGYQERMAMDILFYSFVMIAPDEGTTTVKPIMMLAQFETGMDQQQMEEQIRQSFERQSGRRGMTLELKEVKKMTIRGEETDVIIYEGTDQEGFTMRQLIATFPGKGGTAMLMIMGNPEYWDEKEINQFIESIH